MSKNIDYLEPYRIWVGDSMIKSGADWFMAKCPSHPDNKRSLAIHQDGHHHCKANCGEKGDSAIIAEKCGLDPKPYYRIDTQNKKIPPPSIKESPRNTKIITKSVSDVYLKDKPQIVTDTVVEKYHQNLLNNWSEFDWSVSKELAKGLKLGWDNGKVVIPHYNSDGEVVTLRYHKGSPVKECLDSTCFDNKNKWYPAQKIAGYKKNKPLMIVAGEKDCIHAMNHFGDDYQFATATNGEGSIPKDKRWEDAGMIGFAGYWVIYDKDATGWDGSFNLCGVIKEKNTKLTRVLIGKWDENLPDGWDVTDSVIKDEGKTFKQAVNKNYEAYDDIAYERLYEDSEFLRHSYNNLVNAETENKKQEAEDYAEQLNVNGTDLRSVATKGVFEHMSEEEMLNTDPKPTEWIIENVLPEGKNCVLGGNTGAKKSYYTMQMGMSIANGESHFMGDKILKPNLKVMYVDTECGMDEVHTRFRNITDRMDWTPKGNWYNIAKSGMTIDIWDEVRDTLKNKFDADILLVDSLYNATKVSDFSMAGNISQVTDQLQLLKDEFNGLTIFTVAHFVKHWKAMGLCIESICGASQLQNWVEWCIVMASTDFPNFNIWKVVKTRSTIHDFTVLGLKWQDFIFKNVGEVIDPNEYLIGDKKKSNWRTVLEDLPEKFDTNQWLNVFSQKFPDMTERTSKNWLKAVSETRMVKKVSHGLYEKGIGLVDDSDLGLAE